MTPFQTRCQVAVSACLAARGQGAAFTVQGETEDYLKATVVGRDGPVEVFIYSDEAGLMSAGGEWEICEKWDFDGEDALLGAFLELLERKIG